MYQWIEKIYSLDESICKSIVQHLAKDAFGNNVSIVIEPVDSAILKSKWRISLVMKKISFFLLVFSDNRIISNFEDFKYDIFFESKPMWRDVLKKLLSIACQGYYVSYLLNKAHLIDLSTDLEKFVIKAELDIK